VNGVSGVTGEPLIPDLDIRRAADLARGRPADPDLVRWLQEVWKKLTAKFLGLPLGIDARDPGQAGWGVVFHTEEPAAVRAALEPLIEHRRQRLGSAAVRVLDYRTGEEWRPWLARHGAAPGSVRPERLPYYLLLAGDPAAIPYDLERLLAVEYAVGRLGLGSAAEYARYAESLIAYETASFVPNARRADFFATRHAFDPATRFMADAMAKPLAGVPGQVGFSTRELRAESATKASLGEVFLPPRGTLPPAFLFTATHGLGWPKGHPRQRARQGALVCQDWPAAGTIDERHYFSAADLPSGARVHGLISFHFACYGAGTPRHDEFLVEEGTLPREIAERPFVAALPNALLAHPQGGALAVIGHVERAWGYSIVDSDRRAQLLPFESTLGALLLGWPVGHAVRSFRERYAALAAGLAKLLEEVRWGLAVADEDLAAAWVESNDARNYAVLGDPAARLRVEAMR
jgi:hypothetical protein